MRKIYYRKLKYFKLVVIAFLSFYVIVSFKDNGSFHTSYIANYFLDSITLSYLRKSIEERYFVRFFSYFLNMTLILSVVLPFFIFVGRFLKPVFNEIYIKFSKFRVDFFTHFKSDKRYRIFGTFFVFIILYSLFIYQDFGISTDEKTQYQHLRITGNKIFSTLGILDLAPKSIKNSNIVLDNYKHKYYGVSAQYPLILLEYFTETHGSFAPSFWFMRHLYIRAMFIIAGLCFYLILKDHIKSNYLLFLSLLLFFFHPRVSAHSFYNIKDSLFLSFFTISTYLLFKFIKTKRISTLLVFSFFSAVTINVRMMGVLIPAYFGLWTLFNIKRNFKETSQTILIFLISISLFLYLVWPALWGNPVTVFREAFQTFSNYSVWDGYVIYAGRKISGQEIPIEYLPVWIGLSSPSGYVLVFILGLVLTPFILFKLFKGKEFGYRFHVLLFSFYTVILSYGAIIFFKSTLYGDWRHLYYIYTSLVIMGVFGLNLLLDKKPKLFLIISTFVVLSLFLTFIWMKNNHPHYYVYFNSLLGNNWNYKWDRDIWRLSTKQLLEKLVETEGKINNDRKYLVLSHWEASLNKILLPKDMRDRIQFTSDASIAEYIVGDYRNIIGDYPEYTYPDFYEYINIEVEGKKIITLFKRSQSEIRGNKKVD